MTQPDALRLADELDEIDATFSRNGLCGDAAFELRRLYRVSEDLREKLNHKSYYQARLSKHMRDMKAQRNELLEVVRDTISVLDRSGYPTAAAELRDAVAKHSRARPSTASLISEPLPPASPSQT